MGTNAIIDIDFKSASSGEDKYGEFVEYDAVLKPTLKQIVVNQLEDYVPASDSYIDAYVRRYDDGSARLWVGVNEDFTKSGQFLEQEIVGVKELIAVLADELSYAR